MEYYAFKGPGNEIGFGALEEYDEDNNCWKCEYFIRNSSCVLWKALPVKLWSIEYELTKADFQFMLYMCKEATYRAQTL